MTHMFFILTFSLIKFQFIQLVTPLIRANVLNIGFSPEGVVSFYFHDVTQGLVITTYIADRDNNITEVKDCGIPLWKADTPDTRLSLMKVYRKHQRAYLAYIYSITFINFKTKYYIKVNDRWHQISHGLFQYRLDIFKREKILDLSDSICESVYNTRVEHIYGLPAIILIPYEQFDVIAVHNDYEIIWERKNGSAKCTCAIIHGSLENPKLLHLQIKHLEVHEEIFFINKTGQFENVDKNNFYSHLNDLDIQENQKKTNEESE